MKIVIQCAASKDPRAGTLRVTEGKPVRFIAQPFEAPSANECIYARPDDDSGDGRSWREHLLEYNRQPGDNTLNLLPAYKLYGHPTYSALVDEYGVKSVFVLSAGWGLIPANFLTPTYDITFSSKVQKHKHRKKRDVYEDFAFLPQDQTDPLVFLGGKNYLAMFCQLTQEYKERRIAFYNAKVEPHFSGVELIRYVTTRRINWHYLCAKAVIDGDIPLP